MYNEKLGFTEEKIDDQHNLFIGAIPSQQSLWDRQHEQRGLRGLEGVALRNTPNDSAVYFETFLSEHSTILEVGSANGRDARYWAYKGHSVICLDFSSKALEQLAEIATQQDIRTRLFWYQHDITSGELPMQLIPPDLLEGFYSRSSLHVDNETMLKLATQIDSAIKPGGIILIEGKSEDDEKIQRSEHLGNGLAIDRHEGGHIRRIWTQQFIENMCNLNSWIIEDLNRVTNTTHGQTSVFIRLIAKKTIII